MSFGSTPIANSMYHPYMYRGGKRASRLHDMYYVVGHSSPGMDITGTEEDHRQHFYPPINPKVSPAHHC